MKIIILIAYLFAFSTNYIVAQTKVKPILSNKVDSLKYGWWTKNTQLGANLSGSAF